jgi:pyruvate/2-oxoglutarate dehydrogenase complex dihydrolipoamide acyltransferase (E2) component
MGHVKSSDPNIFILPDLGEGVHEAELLAWKVKVGEHVKEHQILAEMNTDKAQVEVPSPREGVIATLHGKEGEILKVGNPLVTYVAAGGAAAGSPACDTGSQIAANLPKENGQHASAAHAATATPPAPAAAEHREDAGTVVGAVGGALGGVTSVDGKALATPAVRRLARDLGVNIDAVAGSGIGGRVLEKDVRAAAAGTSGPRPAAKPSTPAPAPAPQPAGAPLARASGSFTPSAPAPSAPAPKAPAVVFPEGAETTRVPFRGVRRTIGARLRESMSTAVHFTVMDEADVTALDGLRRKLAAASGEKVSFLPFVASALCRVLTGEFNALNATTDFRAGADGVIEGDIVRHRAVHLGIAVDTDNGLMVPVLRDADRQGVLEISRGIAAVAEAARGRTAPRELLMGSTFTISNVGSHAGRFATPVINIPEVAILAVGRMREGPVVKHGMIGVGKLLPLSLACDHRVIDGATAALCLARLIDLLHHPEGLLEPARG